MAVIAITMHELAEMASTPTFSRLLFRKRCASSNAAQTQRRDSSTMVVTLLNDGIRDGSNDGAGRRCSKPYVTSDVKAFTKNWSKYQILVSEM